MLSSYFCILMYILWKNENFLNTMNLTRLHYISIAHLGAILGLTLTNEACVIGLILNIIMSAILLHVRWTRKDSRDFNCHNTKPNQTTPNTRYNFGKEVLIPVLPLTHFTDPGAYYYTSGTLKGLHGTIGTVNGTLNGLHGMIRTESWTLNGLHQTFEWRTVWTLWHRFNNLHFRNSHCLSLSSLLFIYSQTLTW
jgi:hypothetical protein